MARIDSFQASSIVRNGGDAYAVYPPADRTGIFDDFDEAAEYAEQTGAEFVLDWETGEYA